MFAVRRMLVAVMSALLTLTAIPPAAQAAGQAANRPVGYAFLQTEPDGRTPVRWNPCRTIRVRVNPGPAGKDESVLMFDAMQRVAKATGLRLQYVGTTTYMPQRSRPMPAWVKAEIVIAVATKTKGRWFSDAFSDSGSDVLAVGGPAGHHLVDTGFTWWDSGRVVMSLSTVKDPRYRQVSRVRVYMHELGHVVGLGHSGDRTQVMAPIANPYGELAWGKADLAGLRAVGASAGCFATD